MVPGMTIFVVFRPISQRRDITADTCAERVGEITAHLTAAVSQTVRKGLTFRIQQQACGFAGAGSKDDVVCVDSDILPVQPIDKSDT